MVNKFAKLPTLYNVTPSISLCFSTFFLIDIDTLMLTVKF